MPITKSAKKALRQTKRRTAKNQAQKKELNILFKKATAKNLSIVISKIDKAAKVNLISVARANRLKSRLYKKLKPTRLKPRPKIKTSSQSAKTSHRRSKSKNKSKNK